MGITGPGAGGTAQPPQIRESETTAFVESMKRTLALIPWDSLEVFPFSQGNFDALFKYRAEPDRPLLHPLLHLRLSITPADIEEAAWGPIYDELLSDLPDEIQEWLKREMAKAIEERDLNAMVLSSVLVITAKTIEWLTAVTEPTEANSPEAANTALNTLLPLVALEGILRDTHVILAPVESYLAMTGPNDPNFNLLMGLVNDLKDIITELGELKNEVPSAG